jgi:hypothetical protein
MGLLDAIRFFFFACIWWGKAFWRFSAAGGVGGSPLSGEPHRGSRDHDSRGEIDKSLFTLVYERY